MNATEIFEAVIKKRQITDLAGFLNPDYSKLVDPQLLPDITKAVERLTEAKHKGQKVGIYGDYDLDGISATALLRQAFEAFGINCVGFIPDRFTEGYGMSRSGVDNLKKSGVELIVTVDCGSRSHEEIEYAGSVGIDCIVTDHHEIDALPPAVAVVNPKRADSKYPFRERAGAGVAFGLVQALCLSGLPGLSVEQEKWLLDLVALATVSDVVPLVGENRTLVHFGLKVLNKTKRPGLKALLAVAGSTIVDEETIGYQLGPRLNAAGRLEHARLALDLLTTKSVPEAQSIASELNTLNSERRSQQDEIYKACAKQAVLSRDRVLVFADKKWSHGINGIVASKLSESFSKPSLVMQHLPDGTTKGSARSFGDFDWAKALKSVKHLLVSGGGHQLAAGLTVKTTDFQKLATALNNFARKNYKELRYEPRFDAALSSLAGLNLELVEMLDSLRPFGQGNLPPLFKISGLDILNQRPVGQDGKHVQIELADTNHTTVKGIAFSQAEKLKGLSKDISLIGYPSRNSYQGFDSLQLVIKEVITVA